MGKVTINGVTYTGNNITIRNNNVIIDGKTQYKNKYDNTVNIDIVGNVQNVNCNGTVSVNGTVVGDIDCGGACSVDGDVGGSIVDVREVIQEFEDNLYHRSLKPEISVEAKIIALKALKKYFKIDELEEQLKIEKAKTQWQQSKYKDEHVLCKKYKMLSNYPYHITITDENKDKIPVVPKETMDEAIKMFNDKYIIKD